MKTIKKIFLVLILVSPLTPAFAYLDPGTGSMLLQLVLGGVAGLIVIAKLYWDRLLKFLKIRKEEQTEQENEN